jgi:hypothetical protein
MKRKIRTLIVTISLASTVVIALFQEKPGRGDWVNSLAGDWSIELGNDYTIGPSLDLPDGNYGVMRWKNIGEGRYVLEFVVDGIETYRICGNQVLLRSSKELILADTLTRERVVYDGPKWILIDTLTGVQALYDDPNLPSQFERYKQGMDVPKQSIRTRLIVLSFILGGILVYLLTGSSERLSAFRRN